MKPILILATAATFALASTCSAPAQAAPTAQAKTKAPARKTVVKKPIGNPIVPTRSSRVDIVKTRAEKSRHQARKFGY